MTVIRKSSSGKALLVYDDDGRAYSTSVNFVMGLLNGKSKHDFLLMTRLPFNVAPDRYKKSEVYDPDGVFEGDSAKTLEPLTTGNDIVSPKTVKSNERKEAFKDKKVW